MDENRSSSILEMAKGAIMEQFDVEVGKVIENIIDPNTEPKKKRTITLTVDFIPDDYRQNVTVQATAKSKLLPNNAIKTGLYIGADSKTGELQATELIPNVPGQISFDGEEQEEPKMFNVAVSGGMR